MNLKEKGSSTKKTRKRRLKFGIKQKLLIYFLMVAIIPIVGMTIYSTLNLNQSYESDRLAQLNAIGENKAVAMESWFEQRRGDCDFLSETPTIHELAGDAGTYGHSNKAYAVEEIEEIMSAMLDVYGTYDEMFLLNTSGIVVAQHSTEEWAYPHLVGQDESEEIFFTACYAQRLNEMFTFLTDFHWSSDESYIQIVVSSVIHDEDDNFAGVLVFHIDVEYIHELLHITEGLGNSGETYLVNYEGYWLSDSKFNYYTTETGMYDDIDDIILHEQLTTKGIIDANAAEADVAKGSNKDYRGIAVMGAYHYIEVNDEEHWILVAEIDVSEALKVPNDMMTISIWIVVIIAMIVAIIGFVIAKRFTDPIIRLNSSAVRVAGGDLTNIGDNWKARKGNDEIAVLGRSFATMTENIRNFIASFQKSEQKYKSLFENMLDGFAYCKIILDDANNPVDFIYLEINNAFEKLTGLKKEETIGTRVTEIIPGIQNSKPNLFEIYGKVALTGEETKFELFFEPLKIWLLISVYSPKKGYFVAVFDNITERKIAEEKLKESEEKFRGITEQSLIGIAILQNDRFRYVNKQFADIYGYTPKEIINWEKFEYTKLTHPDDKEMVLKQARKKQLGLSDAINHYQFRGITKKGEVKWLETYANNMILNNESADLLTVVDIKEKKEAEKIIIKQVKRLTELNKMKTDLINRISHELKTPLNAIFGSIQLLMEDFKKDSETEKFRLADVIYKGGNRLKKIIDDLIEISKFELKKIKLKKKRENLNNILMECIEELIFLANKRKIFIREDLGEDVFLQLDRFRIEQVIINIIINAINNTPLKGSIIIKLKDNIKYIDISIKDTGIGLTEEEKEKLFTKFGKIERYGKGLDVNIDGWGLGLYISNEIVQLHGGEILVKSEGRNKGAEFIIRLFKTD